MEKVSIFDEVNDAIREKKDAERDYGVLANTIAEEKAKAIQEIEDKYKFEREAKKKNLSAKNKTFWDACGRLYDYGYFAIDDIVPTLAIFMSYVEGERFIPCISGEAENNSIIARGSLVREKENLSKEKLERMYEDGDAIILSEGFTSCVELYNRVGEAYFRLGNYDYVREFLQRFVEYRAENNLRWFVMLPDVVTYKFMADYLVSHPELKIMNRDKRESMLAQGNNEFRSECAKLELVQK